MFLKLCDVSITSCPCISFCTFFANQWLNLPIQPLRCVENVNPGQGVFLFLLRFFTCWGFFVFSLPMWRFLITGADLNREIKIWCTVTWSCLQTIRYCPCSDYLFNVKMLHNFVYEFYWCSFRCFILFFLPDVISSIFLTLWEHSS